MGTSSFFSRFTYERSKSALPDSIKYTVPPLHRTYKWTHFPTSLLEILQNKPFALQQK